jgi:hypothetical protein
MSSQGIMSGKKASNNPGLCPVKGQKSSLGAQTECGGNLLADLKLEAGACFRNFVRKTPSDFEVLLQMIGCKISSSVQHLKW